MVCVCVAWNEVLYLHVQLCVRISFRLLQHHFGSDSPCLSIIIFIQKSLFLFQILALPKRCMSSLLSSSPASQNRVFSSSNSFLFLCLRALRCVGFYCVSVFSHFIANQICFGFYFNITIFRCFREPPDRLPMITHPIHTHRHWQEQINSSATAARMNNSTFAHCCLSSDKKQNYKRNEEFFVFMRWRWLNRRQSLI